VARPYRRTFAGAMEVSAPSPSKDFPEDEDHRLTPSRSAHCRRTLFLVRSACSERAKSSPPDHQSVYRRVTSVGARVSRVRAEARLGRSVVRYSATGCLRRQRPQSSRKRHELSPATGASPVPLSVVPESDHLTSRSPITGVGPLPEWRPSLWRRPSPAQRLQVRQLMIRVPELRATLTGTAKPIP